MIRVPTGWKLSPLREVCDIVSGGTPKTGVADFWGGNIAWVTPNDLSKDRSQTIAHGERQLTSAGYASCSARTFPAGSVIVSSRAPIGYVAIAGQEMCTNQGCKTAVPPDFIDSKYLYWYMLNAKADLESRASGTTFKEISGKGFGETQLVWPELHEQRRIVDILEDHLSRLDAAQSYLFSAIAGGAAMHRGVLQSATRGQLVPLGQTTHSRDDQLSKRKALCPENMKRGRPEPSARSQDFDGWPESWTQVSLEEATHPVRTISYGILKPGPNLDQGVPYVRVINMRGDTLGLDDLHRTSADIARQYERASLVPGDVLLSIRGTYGRVVQVPEALRGGNITQDTVRLAFVGPIDPSFACVYLRSPQAQAYFKQIARGVAVKGVNIGDLRTMPFPIPPLTEQLQIVAKVAELSSQLEDARLTAESGLRRAATLRHSLLGAAFAGRLTGRSTDVELVEEMAGV